MHTYFKEIRIHLLSQKNNLGVDFSCLMAEKIPQEGSHTVNCNVSTDHDEPREQDYVRRIIWGTEVSSCQDLEMGNCLNPVLNQSGIWITQILKTETLKIASPIRRRNLDCCIPNSSHIGYESNHLNST